jgi:hypothetical protein
MNAARLTAFSTAATFAELVLPESNWFSFLAHNNVAVKRIAYFRSSVWESPTGKLRAEVGTSLYLCQSFWKLQESSRLERAWHSDYPVFARTLSQ